MKPLNLLKKHINPQYKKTRALYLSLLLALSCQLGCISDTNTYLKRVSKGKTEKLLKLS